VTHLVRAEWEVRNVESHAACSAFIVSTHYAAGTANTSVARHGLYRQGESDLMGVAMWMPPTPTAARAVAGDQWRGVLALSRLAVAEGQPTNAASFLLGAAMRMVDRERWPVLLTYADTRLGHTGAIYKATNWTCEGMTPAGDVWLMPDGSQRGRKRGGRNISAAEMREMGATPAPKAPKIRYVHRVAA
jgi:hypothetical protein